jgi:hypothetical protein
MLVTFIYYGEFYLYVDYLPYQCHPKPAIPDSHLAWDFSFSTHVFC